ncbi:MAG: ATP-binding cassette domain-containing protein [Chloroflexi bacterium]|nr:ATP-binding cassette domain-containing protein [Chloroflexota bacterium]
MIETRQLCKTFKAGKQNVEAVRGVNMTVQKGEIFGFLGPNGAGKTTTMRMLSTLLQPSGGEATVAGYDLRRDPAQVRQKIGYVAQGGGSEPSMTGRENLVLQGRLFFMPAADARQRASELITALEMDTFADRIVKTYSGGQRRRMDLALGMVHRPALLFLDEPTTALDPQSRLHLWEEVRRLRQSGTTVFLTTHYLDEADALCDRLAIMDHGQIVAEGTPAELKRQVAGDVITLGLAVEMLPQGENLLHGQSFVREIHTRTDSLQVYVERGEEVLPVILRLLDSAQLPVQTVALARPSLDDVFLRMTGRSLRESA